MTIDRVPGGLALDYIRGNLFAPDKMIPLPFDVPGPDNDLNEKIDYHVQRALAEEERMFPKRDGPLFFNFMRFSVLSVPFGEILCHHICECEY